MIAMEDEEMEDVVTCFPNEVVQIIQRKRKYTTSTVIVTQDNVANVNFLQSRLKIGDEKPNHVVLDKTKKMVFVRGGMHYGH